MYMVLWCTKEQNSSSRRSRNFSSASEERSTCACLYQEFCCGNTDLRYTGVRSGILQQQRYKERNMDSAGTSAIKEEERTVYQDVPEAPDLRTPPLSMHQLDGPRYTVKPKEYAGEGSWRSYRSHFERVATLNRWREEKLEYWNTGSTWQELH